MAFAAESGGFSSNIFNNNPQTKGKPDCSETKENHIAPMSSYEFPMISYDFPMISNSMLGRRFQGNLGEPWGQTKVICMKMSDDSLDMFENHRKILRNSLEHHRTTYSNNYGDFCIKYVIILFRK